MTVNAPEDAPAPDDAPAPETAAETPPETGGGEPDGTDFVEFSDPAVEARFKRVYGHMKSWERSFQALAEHNRQLTETVEQLRAQTAAKQRDSEVGRILAQIRQAKANGDIDQETMLLNRLSEVRAQPIPGPESDPLPEPPAPPSIDMEAVNDWAHEVDPRTGQFKRPWALYGHPRYHEALRVTQEALQQYPDDLDKVLAVVERRMGGQRPTASVIPNSEGRPRATASVELTDVEKEVAQRMGVSFEAYAKQKELIRKQRR